MKIKPIISLAVAALSIIVLYEKALPLYRLKSEKLKTVSIMERKAKSKEMLLYELKKIKSGNVLLGFHRVSTYLFTLLSFVRYLNANGFNVSISIGDPSGKTNGGKGAAATKMKLSNSKNGAGLVGGKHFASSYFSQYKDFKNLKQVALKLSFRSIPNFEDYLFVYKVLSYMPVVIKRVAIKGGGEMSSEIYLVIIGK